MPKKLILLLLILIGIFIVLNREEKYNEVDLYKDEREYKNERIVNWINELEKYECRNCPVGFVRLDKNNKYSYSCLQFQEETFMRNLKKFYPETYNSIEGEEWKNLIYDCDFQKELAYKMIENDRKAIYNWRTSIRRGLGTKLD
ncbi:MAG TPA: hypothetical protein PKV21_07730 [bacterium]|nr:hypothetical protein [bacterium]